MRSAMEMAPPTPEEDLKLLEVRLTQLKLEYEKYFLGSRPTEPSQARSEMQQTVIRLSNMRITNTAQRFKFNSLNGRFQAFKRQWDNVLRQIEAGTYKRQSSRRTCATASGGSTERAWKPPTARPARDPATSVGISISSRPIATR